MKKVFGVFLIALGVFAIGGVASASTADILQPAGATTNMESLRVGVAGQGGVTFFNGSIVNESGPVVIADDMRIDGEIWRGPSKGTSDNMPLKISDTMVPTLTNTNDLGTSSRRWKGIYGVDGNFSGSVVSDGRVLGQTLAEAISSGGSVAGAPGELTASTWIGDRWSLQNGNSLDTNPSYQLTSNISVTFTPTSATEGTFTASDSFSPDLCEINPCTWSGVNNTRSGTYKIIGDAMLLKDMIPVPLTMSTFPVTATSWGGWLTDMTIIGDTMLYNGTTILTRQ